MNEKLEKTEIETSEVPATEETSVKKEEVAETKPKTPKKPENKKPGKRKFYASVKRPIIEAAINELFRFSDEEMAKTQINVIEESFVCSKEQPGEEHGHCIRLWIKGFEVTPEEKEKGYLGNFAIIKYKKIEDKKYTLYPLKLKIELNHHPQKKRPKGSHPDWGHPILRKVQKKFFYNTIEEPQEMMLKLHEEFPSISIPCTNKMYIIIYQKREGISNPTVKIVLETKVDKETGKFYIDWRYNDYQPKIPQNAKATQEGKNEEGGYFSSMVKLKNAPKKSGAVKPRPKPQSKLSNSSEE